MSEFMIEIPHSPEECAAAAVDAHPHPRAGELAAKTYWGCMGGAHTTWIVADFASEHEAMSIVPALLRDTARVVRVERRRIQDPEPGRPGETGR
jgi:hypothetical protein